MTDLLAANNSGNVEDFREFLKHRICVVSSTKYVHKF
jgi:hypothetical protein